MSKRYWQRIEIEGFPRAESYSELRQQLILARKLAALKRINGIMRAAIEGAAKIRATA